MASWPVLSLQRIGREGVWIPDRCSSTLGGWRRTRPFTTAADEAGRSYKAETSQPAPWLGVVAALLARHVLAPITAAIRGLSTDGHTQSRSQIAPPFSPLPSPPPLAATLLPPPHSPAYLHQLSLSLRSWIRCGLPSNKIIKRPATHQIIQWWPCHASH